MERLSGIRESELSPAAFERFAIWTWDDQQEGHHPVSGVGALPLEFGTLFIRATFLTESGIRFNGYLMGLQSFYGFGLFVNGEHYLINLNLPDLAAPEIKKIAQHVGSPSVFPLHYCADVAFEGQPPIQGRFEKI